MKKGWWLLLVIYFGLLTAGYSFGWYAIDSIKRPSPPMALITLGVIFFAMIFWHVSSKGKK